MAAWDIGAIAPPADPAGGISAPAGVAVSIQIMAPGSHHHAEHGGNPARRVRRACTAALLPAPRRRRPR
ncbi:MAG: hypothetical protein WAK28_26825 [Trebonia sp.]